MILIITSVLLDPANKRCLFANTGHVAFAIFHLAISGKDVIKIHIGSVL